MLHRIPFWVLWLKCIYYSFLLKECKGMHDMVQLISNFIYKKKHVSLYATTCSLCRFDGKKSHENFKAFKFWNKGLRGKWFFY